MDKGIVYTVTFAPNMELGIVMGSIQGGYCTPCPSHLDVNVWPSVNFCPITHSLLKDNPIYILPSQYSLFKLHEKTYVIGLDLSQSLL